MKTVMLVCGARSNFMKIAPIHAAMEAFLGAGRADGRVSLAA